MAQGPSDTMLVAIRITLRIRESKVRNQDPPDRRRFVLSEHSFLVVDSSRLRPGAQRTMNTRRTLSPLTNKHNGLSENMTSSKKPEVRNVSQRRERRTEPRPQATCATN